MRAGGNRSPGHCKMGGIRISHGAMDNGQRFANGFGGGGEMSMKVFNKKTSDLMRVAWAHDLCKFITPKIPCESNCPCMVVTDTLNCRKELGGLVDMEDIRGAGRCPFWPHKDMKTKGERKHIRLS
jgi:hypothetical protein